MTEDDPVPSDQLLHHLDCPVKPQLLQTSFSRLSNSSERDFDLTRVSVVGTLAINSPVVRIAENLGKTPELRRSIPAIRTVHNHVATLIQGNYQEVPGVL